MVFTIHRGFSSLAWHSPVRSQRNFPKKTCMHTWIKICGTTCLEDALQSIDAGADALGFIFAPSKRQMSPEQAQQIISKLPHEVEKIGVFMDSTAAEDRQYCQQGGTHGNSDAWRVNLLRRFTAYLPKERRDTLRKIKTILVKDGF